MRRFGKDHQELLREARVPRSVLDSWIADTEAAIDPERQGRLSWLVASIVAVAALQRVTGESGTIRFSLKGATLLQFKLGLASRATKDLDGIVCGDIDGFFGQMDEVLAKGWGPISFSRSEVEEIRVRAKLVNPRRFDLVLSIKGETWRMASGSLQAMCVPLRLTALCASAERAMRA